MKVDASDVWNDEDHPEGGHPARGRFVDVRTLVHALTDKSHTLKSAAEALGTVARKQEGVALGVVTRETIDYNRQDVRVTREVFVKLYEEFARHDLPLAPWNAYSPASLVKAYLRKMGLKPPREKFRRVFLKIVGPATSSFYGGRAECHIRRVPVPVVYTDFRSMYPTVNTLMGLWTLLTAERLRVEEVTEDVQQLLDTLTLSRCFDQSLWPQLAFFAEVLLPDDDPLPVRARYDGSPVWNIGVNRLTASQPFWYAGPDLVAATILKGKAPKIGRAFRLVAEGQQPGLRSIRVRGTTPVDPRTQDFFKTVVQERERLSRDTNRSEAEREEDKRIFKTLGNSGGYGIFAEMNATPTPKDAPACVTVYARDEVFECETTAPEEAGEFCFPPFASLTTAAARLMLAILERCVTGRGGTYAFCDTDSMAIVATERGGPVPCLGGPSRLPDGRQAIRALSWEQVREIQRVFEALNPYDRRIVPGSILKIEQDNFDADGKQRPLFAFVVAAKRYALYTVDAQGQPQIVRYSEHGLGHLLNPTDPESEDRNWIRQTWEAIICRALGVPVTDPPWLDRPALTRMAMTTPHLLKQVKTLNKATSYQDSVKPFNFGLAAHVHSTDRPLDASADGFQLVAPYTSDPHRWERMNWIDRHTGKAYRVHTRQSGVGVRVQTYRDVLTRYPFHPEVKSAGPDGLRCGRTTTGLLGRRRVSPLSITHIGKEANHLEDRGAGLGHDFDEVQADYGARKDGDQAFRQALQKSPSTHLAERSGVSASLIRDICNGRRRITRKTRAKLEKALGGARTA